MHEATVNNLRPIKTGNTINSNFAKKTGMKISENLQQFLSTLDETVKLVAVSKTKPVELIQQAYDAGQRVFGENKAQDLARKQPLLPQDIEWHFIGHLQRNKVKYIAPFVSYIHAVDSLKLLGEINRQAEKHDRSINCLLQFHIAEEESKFGLNIEEAKAILEDQSFKQLQNIHIVGVMGMATYTYDQDQIKQEFQNLTAQFNFLKENYFNDQSSFKEISMGMSGDYQLAIDSGSTMIRVGTAIFGSRNTGSIH